MCNNRCIVQQSLHLSPRSAVRETGPCSRPTRPPMPSQACLALTSASAYTFARDVHDLHRGGPCKCLNQAGGERLEITEVKTASVAVGVQ